MSEDLEIPRFKSSIPESLLENVSDKDRHILDAISIIQQQNAWQMEILKSFYEFIRKSNPR